MFALRAFVDISIKLPPHPLFIIDRAEHEKRAIDHSITQSALSSLKRSSPDPKAKKAASVIKTEAAIQAH